MVSPIPINNSAQNLQNYMNELNSISATGNYTPQAKLKPVQPLQVNITSPTLQSGASGDLAKLEKAIKQQESSNNYSAVNKDSGAAGAYQIMPSNIAEWSKEALGHSVSYAQFMASPAIQDSIAQYKLGQYLNQYGAAGAAAAWYGGPGAVKNMYSTTTQTGGYPSLYAYWTSVLSKM
jgi:Transglycosylase SLT domain